MTDDTSSPGSAPRAPSDTSGHGDTSGYGDDGVDDTGGETPAAPPATPRVDGIEATFRHLDDLDLPWQAVKQQRNADGTVASVWEKWLSFSAEPPYLSLYASYDPGMIVRRHGHYSPHVLFVLSGLIWCADRPCPAGTHIELPLGAAFGPFRAGDDGAVLFEVMMGDPRSWGDDPAAVDALRAEHGVTPLPDPPLAYPPWLEDLRTHWATD